MIPFTHFCPPPLPFPPNNLQSVVFVYEFVLFVLFIFYCCCFMSYIWVISYSSCPFPPDLFQWAQYFEDSSMLLQRKRKRKRSSFEFPGMVCSGGDTSRMLNQTDNVSTFMKLLLNQNWELEGIGETIWVDIMGKESWNTKLKPEFEWHFSQSLTTYTTLDNLCHCKMRMMIQVRTTLLTAYCEAKMRIHIVIGEVLDK